MSSLGSLHRALALVLVALVAAPFLAEAQTAAPAVIGARLAQTFQRVDIDRDGLLDVVVADFLANEVRVIANGGNGKLGAPTRLASGSGPRAVVAADFNQDGWPDVAVSNLLSGTVAIYFGEGGAKFSAPRHVNVGAGLNAMVGADFTGDGQTDLAVANFLSGEVVLLRGQGNGLFEQVEVIGQAPATSVLLVESGSDGSPQLLAVDLKGERASRFVVTAQGSLAAVGEESLAGISIGEVGNGGPARAMTPEGLELRRVSGDGQTARIGDGVLEPFVVEMHSADGTALPGERVSFADLAHDLGQPNGTFLVTDDQGRTGVVLGPATLPGNVVIAAVGGSAQVTLFGATLTMSPVELLQFARLALAGSTIGPADQEHHQSLLADVEHELNKGDVPGAVARLTQSLAILTEAAATPSASESGFVDVVELLTNQLLIVGTEGIAPASTELTCGVPVAGSIAVAGEVDTFTFNVVAGERVEIATIWTSGALAPVWRLLDDTGNPVAGACGAFGGARDCGPLPTSGNPYTIEVVDNTQSDTGTYNINLERLTAGATCANATLTCGTPQVGNIEATADTDVFAFTVTAGERVEISVLWTSGAVAPVWRLLDAAGAPVAGGCGVYGITRDCGPLPTSGNPYAIQVVDNTRVDTGTYNINLERLTAGATCANATLTCGAPQAGNIEATADTDVFAFTVTNGERVEISVLWTSGAVAPVWRLLDAAGAPVAGGCGAYGGARDCGPLPSSGSPYGIQVVDNTRVDTGTYNINLERLTAGAACPNATLTCGTPQVGNIDAAADSDFFTFIAGGSGTVRASVVHTSGAVSPVWRLVDAAGAPVAACGAFGGTRTCSVSSAGSPYGIEVVDNTRTDTGGYTVLLDQCSIPSTGPDLVVTAVSNPPAMAVLGTKITVTDTTNNQGGAAAVATKNRYYFSSDQIKSANDKRLGGARNVPSLGAGASHAGSKAVTVPKSMRTGVYFLLACADDTKLVNEGTNENNNCLASATAIEIKGPDYVVSAVSDPPAAASPGASFSVTDTVLNQGNANATASSTTSYFLSLDTKKSGADILLTGSRTVGLLNVGNSSAATTSVTIPPATAANDYFLIACADNPGNKVAEGNASNTGEKNNCRASATKVTISP